MTFTRLDLKHFEGFGVPDLIGDHCRLLIVGINPGLWTAAAGVHFAHPSNRFWPAMVRAGLIETEPSIRPAAPSVPILAPDYAGQLPGETADAHQLVGPTGQSQRLLDDVTDAGIGITNLVGRATARAAELTTEELRDGARRLEALVGEIAPEVVAVAGITAFRTAFGDRSAVMGQQARTIGGARLWVVPNPSGLNAHETVESLASWYRSAARAAGIL